MKVGTRIVLLCLTGFLAMLIAFPRTSQRQIRLALERFHTVARQAQEQFPNTVVLFSSLSETQEPFATDSADSSPEPFTPEPFTADDDRFHDTFSSEPSGSPSEAVAAHSDTAEETAAPELRITMAAKDLSPSPTASRTPPPTVTVTPHITPTATPTRTATPPPTPQDPTKSSPDQLAASSCSNVLSYSLDDFRPSGGSSEPPAGEVEVNLTGSTITLDGNLWVAVPLPLEVAESTRLEFTFSLSSPGVAHGIALENSPGRPRAGRIFQLAGSSTIGNRDFPYRSTVQHYSIPVGKYFKGRTGVLVFINDGTPDGSAPRSTFSEIRICR